MRPIWLNRLASAGSRRLLARPILNAEGCAPAADFAAGADQHIQMAMDALIHLDGIRKSYKPGLLRGKIEALRGLSLNVAPGEVYALIGPNGAGKTTTFRILLGLIRPDAGEGSIFGFPLGAEEARRCLGFLPESPSYYPFLTVRELLLLAGRLSRLAEPALAVDRAIERFGLARLQNRPLRRLSKGQIQRVGIAQAAVHDPPLLILDEPMSGLDPLGRAEVKEWIRTLRDEGRTVLLASHVLADVEALADRVGLLHEGSLCAEGTAEDLLSGTEEEVEVEFSMIGNPDSLMGGITASLEERSGLWAATLASGHEIHVAALLSRILAHGGTVRTVRRRRSSLEGFYVSSIRGRQEAAGAMEER
jgi:ABC-2 type transport system ATP-binding protein